MLFPLSTFSSACSAFEQARAQARQSRQMVEWAKQGLAKAVTLAEMAEARARAETTGLRVVGPLLLTDQSHARLSGEGDQPVGEAPGAPAGGR
jgi:hypothetical protein